MVTNPFNENIAISVDRAANFMSPSKAIDQGDRQINQRGRATETFRLCSSRTTCRRLFSRRLVYAASLVTARRRPRRTLRGSRKVWQFGRWRTGMLSRWRLSAPCVAHLSVPHHAGDARTLPPELRGPDSEAGKHSLGGADGNMKQ